MQKAYLQAQPVETIYLGGGTPSLLTANEIQKLTETIGKHYNIDNLKEFTIETNPDDLDKQYIKSLRDTGINRFSIGIQSFFDSDLQYMNRAHNAREADYAIKAVQDAGYENITIDLIYGTPGLTDKNWQQNLKQVQMLNIPHLSAYALTVEENTQLHHKIKTYKSAPVDPAQSAHQFEMLMAKAEEMGFEHYEISNFARPGHRALHNTNYWLGVPYLGIGPSAHSFNGHSRQWNIANNALYTKSILSDKQLDFELEILTSEQQVNEYIMTSLRTSWGLNLETIAKKWGNEFRQHIHNKAQQYIEQHNMILDDHTLLLTREGKLFADHIAGELFV